MNRVFKLVFWGMIARPFVLIALGLNIVNREALTYKPSTILAANHNSHLDTILLMSLMPLKDVHKVRPVAAADYFLKSKLLSWFSLNILGIIPLSRHSGFDKTNLFDECEKALSDGDMLIIFPEGSRGVPERTGKIKKGIYHLSSKTNSAVVPVLMRGLGASLPKGSIVPVPFNCDVVVGEPIEKFLNSDEFVNVIARAFDELEMYCITRPFTKQ